MFLHQDFPLIPTFISF